MDVPIRETSDGSHDITRVFQVPYANRAWGFAREAGHKVVGELSREIGSVLISIHGVGTDSVIEAHIAEDLAANCGLKAYMSFESRTSRWRGFTRLSPFHDNPVGLHSARASYEASLLLASAMEVCSRTESTPVMMAHSRGALVLTRAARIWDGLSAIAGVQDPGEYERIWDGISGFKEIWKRLDEGTRGLLLTDRRAIAETRIIAVTSCPAVAHNDPGWASLERWAEGRLWNLYTKRDWFLFFAGNPNRGYVPHLGERNIRFHLKHGEFSVNPLVQKVVASLLKHGDLTRETVDQLIHHYFSERRKLAPATSSARWYYPPVLRR